MTDMSGFEWRGPDSGQWVTQGDCRTVLVVVHTVAAVRRLLDAVRLVDSDRRVKVAFTTVTGPAENAVDRLLRDLGAVLVPSRSAARYAFGLALAASCSAVRRLRAPAIVLPHGVGRGALAGEQYGALAAGGECWEPYDSGARHCGVPAALVLAHQAELSWLRPELRPVATVAGDPAYDRLMASLPLRDFYRRALGVAAGQKLVVVTSAVPGGLLGDLPGDMYRVLALSPSARGSRWAGLPPGADWRVPVVAADWIIGDRGPFLPYGAAAGVPVLLSGAGGDIAPSSAAAELARVAPRLCRSRPLRVQLDEVAEAYSAEAYRSAVERITSEPGRFGRNTRRLMYRLLGLPQPATIPVADPVAPPFQLD